MDHRKVEILTKTMVRRQGMKEKTIKSLIESAFKESEILKDGIHKKVSFFKSFPDDFL
jgi:hypothetical protein